MSDPKIRCGTSVTIGQHDPAEWIVDGVPRCTFCVGIMREDNPNLIAEPFMAITSAPSAPSEPVPDGPRVWGGPGCCRAAYESEGHAHDHVDGTVQYGYRYRAVDRAWTRTWKCKDRDEAARLVAHVRGEGAVEAEVMTRVVQPWRTVSEVVEEATP